MFPKIDTDRKTLELKFEGDQTNRVEFLRTIRRAVIEFTGERMTLDALIHEIAKNIFDHAGGRGSLLVVRNDLAFTFVIQDDGEESYVFDEHVGRSRLADADNHLNFGVGLRAIPELAEGLGIKLDINTSKGFRYAGVYIKKSS